MRRAIEIRSSDLSGIILSRSVVERRIVEEEFDRIRRNGPADSRYGCVLVESCWEDDFDADRKRLDFIAEQIEHGAEGLDLSPERMAEMSRRLRGEQDLRVVLRRFLDEVRGVGKEPVVRVLRRCWK